jgi:hypothetical protein
LVTGARGDWGVCLFVWDISNYLQIRLLHRHKRSRKGLTAYTSTVSASDDGVDISAWLIDREQEPPLLIQSWNFTGKKMFYHTHYLYMTSRTLFIICFNILEFEETSLKFWIHSVQTYAPKSQVIMVGTHIDDRSVTEAMMKSLVEKISGICRSLDFQNVVSIAFLSTKTGDGSDYLFDQIVRLTEVCCF